MDQKDIELKTSRVIDRIMDNIIIDKENEDSTSSIMFDYFSASTNFYLSVS